MAEYDEVMRILMDNANKPFVQRILMPQYYPVMDTGGGKVATHKMAYSQIDTGKGPQYVVYPTIGYEGGKLYDLGSSALDEALNTGNFIQFDSEGKAAWFSKRYKQAWKPNGSPK